MRQLVIGDAHVTKNDLEDCERLIDLTVETVEAEAVDVVVFAGDQYHNHGIIHTECLAFWKRAFDRILGATSKVESALPLSPQERVVAIVGNHDLPGMDSPVVHAMRAHETEITVISTPKVLFDNILMVPFCSNPDTFVEICLDAQKHTKVVMCHQAFNGSQFEGGYYAKDGIDPALIPQSIISGHIHKQQRFANVWHPGSPRWRIKSDANTDKFIFVVEFDAQGSYTVVKEIPTDTHCRPIVELTLTPDTDWDQVLGAVPPGANLRIGIEGPSEWLTQNKDKIGELSGRVRTFSTDSKRAVAVKESEGVSEAFRKYVSGFVAPLGTPTEVLETMVQDRVLGR